MVITIKALFVFLSLVTSLLCLITPSSQAALFSQITVWGRSSIRMYFLDNEPWSYSRNTEVGTFSCLFAWRHSQETVGLLRSAEPATWLTPALSHVQPLWIHCNRGSKGGDSNKNSLPIEGWENFISCLSSQICAGFKPENGLEVSPYAKTQRGELVKSSLNTAGAQGGAKRWKLKISMNNISVISREDQVS